MQAADAWKRARVGDRLRIHFKNLDTLYDRPHSMHFHGVKYRFGSDGAWIPGVSGPGSNVAPGRAFTYTLDAKRDHDDVLLEQLLSDMIPERDMVFGDLVRETRETRE